MSVKIFVDGREGTTGLKIIERLKSRKDIEILLIDSELRRDKNERKRLINMADYLFLCLPDSAAKESVSMIENKNVKVIDASTAHRVEDSWTYGLPEISDSQYESVRQSSRVAVPGCYACGFIALVAPLVLSGIIPADFPVTSFAVSGYSGAGKQAIAEYEALDKPPGYFSPRLYALGQWHKHLPEMQKYTALKYPPMFNPLIDDYYSGMLVNVPLQMKALKQAFSSADILDTYIRHYKNRPLIRVACESGFLSANGISGKDYLEIFVNGDENNEKVLLTARLDNLGKGASGAAVQCLNIMMGIDEVTGLAI